MDLNNSAKIVVRPRQVLDLFHTILVGLSMGVVKVIRENKKTQTTKKTQTKKSTRKKGCGCGKKTQK
ncbi:hypothetical protein [Neobacillus sp. DY30]|uniref:hypothetical protein n=1 Tax=Neobacillus sp. DY30 TaxID=3047871 RepID=UPI0024BFE8D8|nr:hypothetical protein [Neobacillus sp. DY30]WHY02117.1 hypothetical protein QNH29_07765 [Neobacillus sp. DY30]